MALYTDEERQSVEQFQMLSEGEIPNHIDLANAVATLALSTVQSRLPQCGVFDGEGRLTLARKRTPAWRRDIVLLPQHLFTINWADTAPGISWPETYYAAYLPVITMQRDHNQDRFAYVWAEGRISHETANQWADHVWSVDIEEDE